MFELFDINFYYAKEQESRDSKLFTLDDVIKEGGGTPLLSIDMFLPENTLSASQFEASTRKFLFIRYNKSIEVIGYA